MENPAWLARGLILERMIAMPSSTLGPRDHSADDERRCKQMLGLRAGAAEEFLAGVQEQSARLGLDYIKDSGERIVIPVTALPAVPSARQLNYMAKVLGGLRRCVARIASRRAGDEALANALDLGAAELSWLKLAENAPGKPASSVFHRWDLALALANDPGAERFQLFEVNSVDVGGIHYASASREVLLGALRGAGLSGLSLDASTAGADPRRVLLAELRRHARRIGRDLNFLAIAENQDFTTGITEAQSLVEFFQQQGLDAACVDVRAFEQHPRHGVRALGRTVDVIYRNVELRDLAELEAGGANLTGLRAAMAAGRVCSSAYGELDHKSLWELLTSPDFARHLTPRERDLARRHVPWTRLLSERRTPSPQGRDVDLPSYVAKGRNSLVMKPNRSCGGQGVTIGRAVSASTWEDTLNEALAAPGTWVVQSFIPLPRRKTVVRGPSGRMKADSVYAVYGVFAAGRQVAFVGRASQQPVVNVMQGGGMMAVLGRSKP